MPFSKKNNFCSVLVYMAGIIFFILLNHPNFSENCYFSENALLPGLVRSQFKGTEKDIQDINREIIEQVHGDVHETLMVKMQDIGMEVYQQEFSFQDEFVKNKEIKNGSNIYGIVRAARLASTECIVINIPFLKEKHNFASGFAIALAKEMRKQFYWSKDVVLLFSEHGTMGTHAWLNSYHGTSQPNIKAGPLLGRAGAMQAAIVLEFHDRATSYINLKIEGDNGRLPNLDLVNLVVRLGKIGGIAVALNHRFSFVNQHQSELEQYMETTFEMMMNQVTGWSTGNHGAFITHNVQALTMEGVFIKQWGKIGFTKLAVTLEGICRSLGNLMERFHQSFFFYLLPSTEKYISIGMYMPALGLIMLAPVLKALSLLVEFSKEDTNEQIDNESEELTQKILKPNEMEDISRWNTLITVVVSSYAVGLLLFYSPHYSSTWSQMFGLSLSESFVLLLTVVHISGMVLPNYCRLNLEMKVALRTMALLQVVVVFGTVSIINFSLGIVMGSYVIITTLFLHSTSGRFKNIVMRTMCILSSPAFILCAASIFKLQSANLSIEENFTKTIIELITETYNSFHTNQSWLYGFITLLLYPIWLQFWVVASS